MMKKRTKTLLSVLALSIVAAGGVVGGWWWHVRTVCLLIEQSEHNPRNSPLSIHLRLPENGAIECEYQTVTLDEMRVRAERMASAFGPWSVRPVLHVVATTPFTTFMRVIDALRVRNFFVISLSYQTGGEGVFFDFPDHTCPHILGPHLTLGVSNDMYWVESPSNTVGAAALRKRVADMKRGPSSHLHLVVSEEEINTAGLLQLVGIARQGGFTEATLGTR